METTGTEQRGESDKAFADDKRREQEHAGIEREGNPIDQNLNRLHRQIPFRLKPPIANYTQASRVNSQRP